MRSDFREARQTSLSVGAWAFWIVLLIAVVGFFGWWIGAASSVATASARVIEQTMGTNNIITKYEWFHDANGVFQSRLATSIVISPCACPSLHSS